MIPYTPPRRLARPRPRPWRRAARVCLELLECRTTPSLTPWPGLTDPVVEAGANDTADLALDLGALGEARRGEAVGTVGGASGAADVDWYKFSLDRASRVVLSTLNELAGTSLVSALSLFNADADSWGDPHNPVGNRLLAQADAADGGRQDVRLVRDLPAGTYYVALSGSGNRDFHPYLADSGQVGSTGDYGLLLTVTDLGLDPAGGPAVVSTDPEDGAVLSQSPFVIRVTFHEALDPSTLPADPSVDDWVQLRYDASGDFGDGPDGIVPLSCVHYSTAVNELQLTPRAPLRPGFYQVFLAGNALARPTVLRDPDGNPLGFSAANPDGADFTAGFQIDGAEGVQGDTPPADDTPDTGHALGALAVDQFVRRQGAVGDDPAYDPALEDPLLLDPLAPPPYLSNPAADVDVYSFAITGPGSYLLVAEAWAGRVGSPLDPALSLYRRGGPGEPPTLLAVVDSTLNPTQATNGQFPIFPDAVLFRSLTAGQYFLVVSSNDNRPVAGAEGVFDPTVSHSGRAGAAAGRYVLNVGLRTDAAPPEVLQVTPRAGDDLAAPPRRVVVRFSEYMNLYDLATRAYAQTTQSTVSSVWVEAADGTRYFPRLDTYDTTTNEAVFLMLDGLAPGAYTLHLSGAEGLTDIAGNPLAGNDPAGDYLVSFTVGGPARARDAQGRLAFASQEPNDSPNQPHDLGVLFPHEIETGVVVTRDFTADPALAPADSADYYRFEVLQPQTYLFLFLNHNLAPGTQPQLRDSAGNLLQLNQLGASVGGGTRLDAGVYTLEISGWTPSSAAGLKYEFHLRLQVASDNPPPVATGAFSASRFRLVTNQPAPPPPAPAGQLPQQPEAAGGEAPPAEQPPPPPPVMGPPQPPPPAPPAGELPPPPPAPLPPPPPPLVQEQAPPPVDSLPPAPPLPPQEIAAPPPVQVPPAGNPFPPQGPSGPPLGPAGETRNAEPAPPPAPPVLVVTTLVAPILPETTTVAVITPTLTVSVRPPEGAVVPTLLNSLRAGPVGGVLDPQAREGGVPQLGVPNPSLLPTTELLVRIAPPPPSGPGSARETLSAGTPGELGSWQRALDLLFSTPPRGADSPPPTPEMLLQRYQQLRQLWNEAFQALFTYPGVIEDSERESEFNDAEALADFAGWESRLQPAEAGTPTPPAQPDGLLGQSLAAAGAALLGFRVHGKPGRRPTPRRERREDQEE